MNLPLDKLQRSPVYKSPTKTVHAFGNARRFPVQQTANCPKHTYQKVEPSSEPSHMSSSLIRGRTPLASRDQYNMSALPNVSGFNYSAGMPISRSRSRSQSRSPSLIGSKKIGSAYSPNKQKGITFNRSKKKSLFEENSCSPGPGAYQEISEFSDRMAKINTLLDKMVKATHIRSDRSPLSRHNASLM